MRGNLYKEAIVAGFLAAFVTIVFAFFNTAYKWLNLPFLILSGSEYLFEYLFIVSFGVGICIYLLIVLLWKHKKKKSQGE